MDTDKDMIKDGFLKSSDTDSKSYRRLLHATKEGEVTRLKRGVYATDDALADTMIDIEKIVPGGILCLYSAWSYYEMTTQIPSAFFIAINRDRKVVVPDFPEIQLIIKIPRFLLWVLLRLRYRTIRSQFTIEKDAYAMPLNTVIK